MGCRPALSFLLLAALAAPAAATEIAVEGLVFSDELGGFALESVIGTGTLADPFVVVERVSGRGAAVLTVSGLESGFGNRIGTHHLTGFAMTKVVTNGTGQAWRDYPIELQERLGDDSPYGDGLSFAQGPLVTRTARADAFDAADLIDEPRDGVTFSDGTVEPGQSVAVHFTVTDTTPAPRFYVVQRRAQPVALLLP